MNTGTGFCRPARDLSVNFVPVPYPIQLQNRVPLTVEPNHHVRGVRSQQFYDSFSLLKSLEGAYGLRCLNHACDAGVAVMSDLFGAY